MQYCDCDLFDCCCHWAGLVASCRFLISLLRSCILCMLLAVRFPSGMTVAGLLHIVNNLTLEIDRHLTHWPWWLARFKELHKLLQGDRRRRFVSKCIAAHANLQPFEAQFNTDLPPIASWRWGTISKVVKPLRKLKYPLQRCWDADAYRRDEDGLAARHPMPEVAPGAEEGSSKSKIACCEHDIIQTRHIRYKNTNKETEKARATT